MKSHMGFQIAYLVLTLAYLDLTLTYLDMTLVYSKVNFAVATVYRQFFLLLAVAYHLQRIF